MMNRRNLLKLLSLGVIGHTLDVDKLLWVPGQKKIFLPSPSIKPISCSAIIELEIERILPKLRTLFERDDTFYQAIKNNEPTIRARVIHVPLEYKTK